MQGKTLAISGPTAGIGRETARHLAGQGAELILLCRSPDKGEALAEEIATSGNHRPAVIEMDMASLASVRAAGEAILALEVPLDVLVNNAGVVNTKRVESVDGFEETLAVNHLAPFLLTGLVMPALQAAPAARIVNVSSGAHHFVRGMGFDDMQADKGYRTFREYGRSKLANLLFTLELARRLEGTPMTVNSLHPGAVSTSLGTQNGGLLSSVLPLLLKPFFRSPAQGAETSIFLASSPAVEGVNGQYFVNCKAVKPKPWALDEAAARRLWQFSEDCVGFTYPV